MKVITEDKVYDNFAFIIEITDEQLKQIETDPKRITYDKELMTQMVQTNANNAHVLQLTLCMSSIRLIVHINKLLETYDSVSWVDNDNKFHIKRK